VGTKWIVRSPVDTHLAEDGLFVSSLAYRPLHLKVGYQLKANALRGAHAENVDLHFFSSLVFGETECT
jgi:hypothetical protein